VRSDVFEHLRGQHFFSRFAASQRGAYFGGGDVLVQVRQQVESRAASIGRSQLEESRGRKLSGDGPRLNLARQGRLRVVQLETGTRAHDEVAGQKQIGRAMRVIRDGIDEAKEAHASRSRAEPPAFSPAGQATQMIVGATDATDRDILHTATSLYSTERLRRVYYSAFSPIPDASPTLPPLSPPLLREHRLYQADWLMRFYGFRADELTEKASPHLELNFDPKLAWALRNRESFPLDLNTAPREMLLRVPGIGVRSVDRILLSRRHRRLRFDDLTRLHVSRERALPFVIVDDYRPGALSPDRLDLRDRISARNQLDLFSAAASARSGEL